MHEKVTEKNGKWMEIALQEEWERQTAKKIIKINILITQSHPIVDFHYDYYTVFMLWFI